MAMCVLQVLAHRVLQRGLQHSLQEAVGMMKMLGTYQMAGRVFERRGFNGERFERGSTSGGGDSNEISMVGGVGGSYTCAGGGQR